ncbi:MAG TPA: CoA-acylating methylmalonate-semialdehyde dehydrogenase [Acidimicrobiales bacterium]|jgi:malonate-semialdehyde dehydrogenase (acetylating)/methylmalonate-semialdehyde dehydrogenase|nr:CoA-acylating methylmalonate-semialdehyde dehydrogenase [Acidimicrobiales bacterium]
MHSIGHWVDGKLTPGTSGRTSAVYDPARGEQSAAVELASSGEVSHVVAIAARAAADWSTSSLSARSAALFRFRELLDSHRSELAALVTAEHGKVLSDAAGEVARGLENVEFACAIPHLLKGSHSTEVSSGVDVHTVLQPLGVVAGITPFNFPVMVPLWMLANAIACGNSFILKPSEKDPSPSLLLAELVQQAGVPDGVFSVVQGDHEAVDALLIHPDVAAISFVGSTPIARHIYETGTKAGKRVQALGGAKNHMVVLPDADVDAAADAAISAGYGSAGERCMAISVVVAVGSIAEPLVAAIAERIPSVVVGPGTDPTSQMGPLITAEHRERVLSYVDGAENEGASLVVDGRGDWPTGYYVGCTLLDHVGPGMKVYDDEIFGPVLGVARVDTYEDAVALVNANPYGNGVAVFTRDGGAARRFQLDVTVGMVGVNVSIPVPVGFHSFGGWKSSLFGDSAMYGPEGIRFYTRPKVVTTRWPDPSASAIDLGFPQTR